MCWVMPPASPATTLAWRIASSSEVLPWSTWPMMVTTGGRGRRCVIGVRRVEQAFLDIGFGDALHRVAHFLGDELRGVGIDHVGDLGHLALLHQELDDVDGALGHAVGEFLDGDRLGQDDFARQLFLGLRCRMALEALDAPAERGDGAHPLLFLGGCAGDGEAAAVLLLAAAGGLRRQHDLGRQAGPADDPLGLLLVRLERAARWPASRRPAAAAQASPAVDGAGRRSEGAAGGAGSPPAEPAFGFLLGSALGFRLLVAARLFLALARFCGFALRLLLRLALGARLGFDFGTPPLFLFAPARFEKGAGAGIALFLGQRAQDDARLRPQRMSAWRRAAAAAPAARRRPARRAPSAVARAAAPRCGRRRGSPARGFARRDLAGPIARRLTFSTTTALERPCEKL